MWDAFVFVIAVALTALITVGMWLGTTTQPQMTGPNCPGMDMGWLGYCE